MKPTLIIGASARESSYAFMAMENLEQAGHDTLLFNPHGKKIGDRVVYQCLDDIESEVNTVTLYVRPSRLEGLIDELIQLKPKRVIFNPGTEDEPLKNKFSEEGVEVLEACTLVMLRTGQY